jgi:hypothetical protein
MSESVEQTIIIDQIRNGADQSYLDMVKASLADEWARDVNASVGELAESVNVVGRSSRLTPAGAKSFQKLIRSLRIPIQLNGQDLIIGIQAGNDILPHLTIIGEFAIAVRDPRCLLEINTDVEHNATSDGLYVISKAELVYDNYGAGARFGGKDATFLPSWSVFRDGAQEIILEEIREQIKIDQGKNKPLSHYTFANGTRILQELERGMNRSRGFATRASETFALRRAFAHARGRLQITPMADNDLLDKITIKNKPQLLTAALGFGITPSDIMRVLDVVSLDEIKDDQAVVSRAWGKLIEEFDLKRMQ